MIRRPILTVTAMLCFAAATYAASPGMDAARLKLIPKRIQEFVDDGAISGAITLVARHGEIAALDAVGYSDIEAKKPMRPDTIVQIMSQTKSFTGVAAMMLVEEGKLDLRRPVQDYLPEFKGQMLEEKRPDGIVSTRRPQHPPTVWFPHSDEKRARIAMIYLHEDGKLSLAREKAQAGDAAKYRAGAKYPGPELGLYSTATDLMHFYQMLANGGVFAGRRYLSKQTIEAMTKDYTPDHKDYGLTLSILSGAHSLLNLVSPGTYGHGGAFGTGGWVDPSNDLVMVFLAQMNDGTANLAKDAFWQIAESAVTK
jgi:CubicO group peptidase (beta-lactamase class C family)